MEFLPIFRLLTKRYTAQTLPYHFIVPSLPGFGFSDAPSPKKDFKYQDIAFVMNQLMVAIFGDGAAYVSHGGDVGSRVARMLAVENPACKGQSLSPHTLSQNTQDDSSRSHQLLFPVWGTVQPERNDLHRLRPGLHR